MSQRVVALIAALAALGAAQRQTPSGLIVGQVVDAVTGRPIAEAEVRLTGSTGLAAAPRIRVVADADGWFYFVALPAGSYSVIAAKPGYADGTYGMRRPPTAANRAPGLVPFELAEGQRRADATIRLWKNASLSGVVNDEAGEAMPGVTVRALQRMIVAGRPRLVGGLTTSASTDDRGMYRLSSLPPGSYVLVIPTTQTTLPAATLDQWARSSGTEQARLSSAMFGATAEFGVTGNSRNQQFGDHVLLTSSTQPIPPAPASDGRLLVFPTTFYPSMSSPAEASVITVAAGEERAGLNIQLRAVPAVRVAGRLVGPRGPVPLASLRLTPVAYTDYLMQSGFDTVTAISDDAGQFVMLGVPVGQYELRVRDVPPRVGGVLSTPPADILWATEQLRVGETNVSNLVVTLRESCRVSGRLEFRGSKPPPEQDIAYTYINFDPVQGSATNPIVPEQTGAFTTSVPCGQHFVRVEEPIGWWVSGMTVNGRESDDAPIDLTGDTASVVIGLTDEPTRLSGIVRNAQGAPDPSALVIAYPVSRQAWTGYNSPSRSLQGARPTIAGAYTVTNLPAGEYFVVAIPDEQAIDWIDPKTLEALSRDATRVSLGTAEKRALDLRTVLVRR
jgi:hypothetical protein